MLKKAISIFVVFCLLSGTLVFAENIDEASVYLYEDSYPTSGEIINSVPNNPSHTPSDNMMLRKIDGTNADGTMNMSDEIKTELEENSSKYNGMQTSPLPSSMAKSRYSNTRVSLAPDISDTKYAEAAELLGALGIMVGDAESGLFRPNDDILRSEMAKVAVYTIGLEEISNSSAGSTRFPDVPEGHWATGAISTAHQQGMVVGDDIGTFRPDDNVLFQEAVAIIVRALGYEPAAQDRGGYPAGYMYIASSNQLFKGIDASGTEPAKRGDIAQMVFNALTVNLMEQTGYGSTISYEVVDKTLLYDKLNVEKKYGQIVGTSETTLTGGNTTADDKIMIDKDTYLEGDTNAKQFLGYNVLYYARLDKSSDEKTLIVVREQPNKNNAITINAADIVNVTGGGEASINVEYWADKSNDRKTKNATITASPTYIFNGKFKDNVAIDALKPQSGNLVLLDTDGNSAYDIVFVNHFSNLVVDTISNITGRVTDKYNNGSLVFDEDNTDVKFSIIKDNNEITLNDLKEWNVLSYTISEDKELIRAYVSDASVTGTITEVSDDGYRIGESDTLYEKASSYPNEIRLRDKGTFYLDYEGKIAAVNKNATVDQNQPTKYGYLLGSAMKDGFNTTAQFKIYTAGGETTIFDSGTKMRLNSTYGVEPQDVISAVSDNQLIVYETNSSGNITAIETAVDRTAAGTPNKSAFTLNVKKDDAVYKSASSKLDTVTIADDTIIFDIPATANGDTDRFSIRNKSSLSNDSKYNVLVYDLQENYAANVIIITSSTGVAAPESPILVVDRITETQNENYEYTDRLYGYQDGKQISLLATDKNVFVKRGHVDRLAARKLQSGDIIQYKQNSKGEVDGITLLFDIENKEHEFREDVTDDLTVVYGRATKKFSGSVNVQVGDEVINYATADTTVYLYDTSRTRDNISVVSPADIELYEEDNEARLFIKIYQDVVQEMVIVR